MQRNNNHGSHFLLGVIVGVVITLLITTKKGRRILKMLSEEGYQKFTDLEELWEREQKKKAVEKRLEDSVPVDDDIMEEIANQLPTEQDDAEIPTNGSGPKISTGRRFFKGTHKKV